MAPRLLLCVGLLVQFFVASRAQSAGPIVCGRFGFCIQVGHCSRTHAKPKNLPPLLAGYENGDKVLRDLERLHVGLE